MTKEEERIVKDEFDAAIRTQEEHIKWYDQQYLSGNKYAEEHSFRHRIIATSIRDLRRSLFIRLYLNIE